MPNWCESTIVFKSDDTSKVHNFVRSIDDNDKLLKKLGIDEGGLSNLALMLGLPVGGKILKDKKLIPTEETSPISFRGNYEFDNFVPGKNHFKMYCTSAWSEPSEIFEMLSTHFDLDYEYISIEEGMEYYIKHSSDDSFDYFPETFFMDYGEDWIFAENVSEILSNFREMVEKLDLSSSDQSIEKEVAVATNYLKLLEKDKNTEATSFEQFPNARFLYKVRDILEQFYEFLSLYEFDIV